VERRKGWVVRISTIDHRTKIKKGRKDQEADTVNISPQTFSRAKAMMKARSRSESASKGGYDKGTLYPSTNPYIGGPEQAVYRIGCVYGRFSCAYSTFSLVLSIILQP
jgi:hypothetical protein